MKQNTNEGFDNKEEALDFLLDELSKKKQKEKWAKSLGGNPAKKTKVIKLRKRILSYAGVAASIVLIAFFAFNLNKQSADPQQYASNMIMESEISTGLTTRGGSDIENYDNLLKALDKKDYATAANLFESKTTMLSIEEMYNYALVLAKEKEPRHAKVLELTGKLIKSDSEFKAEALWLSAATNIRLNNFDLARKELNELKAYKYKTEEISEVLEILSNHK